VKFFKKSLWKLGKLNHIAIAVPDIDKAVSLYKNVLNAQKVSEKTVSMIFLWRDSSIDLLFNKYL